MFFHFEPKIRQCFNCSILLLHVSLRNGVRNVAKRSDEVIVRSSNAFCVTLKTIVLGTDISVQCGPRSKALNKT